MDKKEIDLKFKNYLLENWKKQENLTKTTNRFGLKLFDVFLDWLNSYRKNFRWYEAVFYEVVLPKLKMIVEPNFWNIYIKQKNCDLYKSLFVSFMWFCKKNKEYVDLLLFEKKREKFEKLYDWKWKYFLENWHKYVQNDNWKNGDKIRKYLVGLYNKLDEKELKILYNAFVNAYKICSNVNQKNKWKENDWKLNAFETSFSKLSENLKLLNIEEKSVSEIRSIFWKFLHFVPYYREKIEEAISSDTKSWINVQEKIQKSLFEGLGENGRISIEWDWFWPIEVINEVRDPKWWNYDEIERGDIVAPIDNFWIFPESEINIKPKKISKKRKNKKQIEIEF